MVSEPMRRVAVVGGGPAGLMAAEALAGYGIAVSLYEQHRIVGRKLLLAGRSGLNLTNDREVDDLLDRYAHLPVGVADAVRRFPPNEVRAWAQSLGQVTFVGSGGKVFPEAMRAAPLLRAWLARLSERRVDVVTGMRMDRWPEVLSSGAIRLGFSTGISGSPGIEVDVDAVVLSLGGASWPRTGSDARWVDPAARAGVEVAPLRPSNAGWRIAWSSRFSDRFDGSPLKNIAISVGDRTERGEALVTTYGLEGGPIYALGAAVRHALAARTPVEATVDLRPDLDRARLADHLGRRRASDSLSTVLARGARLSPAAAGLARESLGDDLPTNREALAAILKALPLRIESLAPIDRAISTDGGIAESSLDGALMLAGFPGVFLAGEMVDWDAPTGGYLLHACLATGAEAARQVAAYLAERDV